MDQCPPDYQYLYQKYKKKYINLMSGGAEDDSHQESPILPISIFCHSVHNGRLLQQIIAHRESKGETDPITQWQVININPHNKQVAFLGTDGQLLAKTGIGHLWHNYTFGGPHGERWDRGEWKPGKTDKQTLPE
jgi:hypothetical protein